MLISVLVPTHARPERLERCLRGLAGQSVDNFEILVGVDGEDGGPFREAERAAGGRPVRVLPAPHAGPAATRNRIIAEASGPLLLLLNDDVEPAPDLVERHLDAHRGLERPAMVLGSAPWAVREPDRLFDRLIRETSMVFFYDRMDAMPADPDRDWGFRHAWTLNLSVPTDAARAVGGFCEALPGAAYEDLEFAWKLRERFGMPVLYRPGAVVTHDHRYEPGDYLRRERAMGRDAWALAGASPACARELFGRDVRSAESVAYARAFVERERPLAERLARSFGSLADLPADAVRDPRLLTIAYEHHLALKRWHWSAGLVEAADACGVRAIAG